MVEQWDSQLQARKRSKPLTHPTREQRVIQPAALLAQLSVVELPTDGYHSNCLWFSVQRALGKLSATREQLTVAGQLASDRGREWIHQELLQALPANAENGVGCNEEWWGGFSCARAKRVYRNKQ